MTPPRVCDICDTHLHSRTQLLISANEALYQAEAQQGGGAVSAQENLLCQFSCEDEGKWKGKSQRHRPGDISVLCNMARIPLGSPQPPCIEAKVILCLEKPRKTCGVGLKTGTALEAVSSMSPWALCPHVRLARATPVSWGCSRMQPQPTPCPSG